MCVRVRECVCVFEREREGERDSVTGEPFLGLRYKDVAFFWIVRGKERLSVCVCVCVKVGEKADSACDN